ncbi:hypothetical protein [Neisseria sicca]|uniref:hypothetical protein n=1 Tax=Neisseria sicca TaxID=490 RepID=UPI0034D97761
MTLFHYPNHPPHYPPILLPIHLPSTHHQPFQNFLQTLPYTYHHQTQNPPYPLFLPS